MQSLGINLFDLKVKNRINYTNVAKISLAKKINRCLTDINRCLTDISQFQPILTDI